MEHLCNYQPTILVQPSNHEQFTNILSQLPAILTQTQTHLRKGYLAESIPIFVSGLNGPAAPHTFEFLKREDLGNLAQVIDT